MADLDADGVWDRVVATVTGVSGVFDRLVGQDDVEQALRAAALAARDPSSTGSAMTHAWLFTGPPGSGRSVAAVCLAAALECTDPGLPGCGHCAACHTVLSGTHGDVRRVVPEGLSIGVGEMRAIVRTASRSPTTGRWQVVLVEDADRLTEQAANALLKAVEEPPPRTVFLLCAPSIDPEDISMTLRSRCRHVALRTPTTAAVGAGAPGAGRALRRRGDVGGVGERRARRPGTPAGHRRRGARPA